MGIYKSRNTDSQYQMPDRAAGKKKVHQDN